MIRPRFRFLLLVLLLAGTARPSEAAKALIWATGNATYGNTQGVADYVLAAHCFDAVDAVDADLVPLSTLVNYDAVLYFSNTSLTQDPGAIGDVLADYSDTGRRLVVATFSWAQQGSNTLGGRLIADGISPFVSEGGSVYSDVDMASNDGSTYFTPVASLHGHYHDNVLLSAGAVLRASWTDGEPLLADKNNVVAVNLFPDGASSNGLIGGDWQALFSNALCRPMDPVATRASSWGNVKARYR
jgi:hypothetical protein